MRPAAVLAVLLVAGCGSTRPVEAPAPYETLGYLIEVEPRVRTDWLLGFQEIRGTVRNGAGKAADILIVLRLLNEAGERVGQAIASVEDLRPGTAREFEALVLPSWVPDTREWLSSYGTPESEDAPPAWTVDSTAEEGGEVLRYEPPPFSRVEPDYVLAAAAGISRD